jgi:hypothetical protein
MGKKIGRNDPCPCGSGKKLKKCCGARAVSAGYTKSDRESLFTKLDAFVDRVLDEEDALAHERFWGRFRGREEELDPRMVPFSNDVFDLWFAFDEPLDDGRLVADLFLDRVLDLTPGERAFLSALRASSMHLYEIMDMVPGVSITLRDVLEGEQVGVAERKGSRTLGRHEWIAARVVARGASGKPELEAGLLHIPRLLHEPVLAQLKALRAEHGRQHGTDLTGFYKALPPFFHDAWVGAILEPVLPALHNTDGEEMVVTRVLFDVGDAHALATALDACGDMERDGERHWQWSGKNERGEPILLGSVEIDGSTAVLEANSVRRGERGRQLVESLAGEAVRYHATTHEDLGRLVRESIRSRGAGGPDRGESPPVQEIPFEIQETLLLNHYARHYRAWLDDSIPALGGRTPRLAAKDPALRPKLVDLLHDLEAMYRTSLRRGEPAYDPSWMWAELGFGGESSPSHPPPLAHERVAELVTGAGELSRSVAEALRSQPGFRDTSTIVTEDELGAHLGVQRFLRDLGRSAGGGKAPAWSGAQVAPYLTRMVNFELHRRKSFWVDESLSYMLAQTDLDVLGRELRSPFPCWALVFTDRHVLSMGERLLSRQPGDALAGQLLRVATVWVTEHPDEEKRRLELCFAFDALGVDLPSLVSRELLLADADPVQRQIEATGASVARVEPPVPEARPLRGLLQVALNAILYATSAGVEPEIRPAPAERASGARSHDVPIPFSSDKVYFLPGAIEISRVRRMQELERVPDGRPILRRFMVRGHWRRPARTWADQRMRWIQPYWKGPAMAAIIERTYKLKP